MLPDVPGEEVARTALRLPQSPAILLMSGDRVRLERARSLADATLAKPFGVEQLERVVQALALGRRRDGGRRQS